jgi:hypothetical protein
MQHVMLKEIYYFELEESLVNIMVKSHPIKCHFSKSQPKYAVLDEAMNIAIATGNVEEKGSECIRIVTNRR